MQIQQNIRKQKIFTCYNFIIIRFYTYAAPTIIFTINYFTSSIFHKYKLGRCPVCF